jgi:uncharacterized protein YifE (UPF0438 family)
VGPRTPRRIEISGRSCIILRNQFGNGRGERLPELFEGVKGRRPKTEDELHEWFASPEGKAATLFNLTSLSRWGERALSLASTLERWLEKFEGLNRGDGSPANHCNGRFRVGGKSKRAPVHRSAKQYSRCRRSPMSKRRPWEKRPVTCKVRALQRPA